MLNDNGRDLAALCGLVIAALIAAAFLIPTEIRRPPGTAPPPTASPPARAPALAVVIGVYNAAPRYRWSLDRAIRAWNSSGAHVRFTYTARPDADVGLAGAANRGLRFGGGEAGAPSPSAIVVFGRPATFLWWDWRDYADPFGRQGDDRAGELSGWRNARVA